MSFLNLFGHRRKLCNYTPQDSRQYFFYPLFGTYPTACYCHKWSQTWTFYFNCHRKFESNGYVLPHRHKFYCLIVFILLLWEKILLTKWTNTNCHLDWLFILWHICSHFLNLNLNLIIKIAYYWQAPLIVYTGILFYLVKSKFIYLLKDFIYYIDF